MIGIVALIFAGTACFLAYKYHIAKKLDCPANNELVKGLEKKEIKETIKDYEVQKKEIDKEIKELEKERKEILKSEDADKADKAQEKLETKQEKLQELEKMEQDLGDLKAVEKGDWKAALPNKLNLNNGLWIGGLVIGYFILYKICDSVFRSLFRAIGWTEE